MPYQNFWNRKGGSDSSGKLQTLKLPNLEGKSLLDIGCNEGFFCIEAKKRGAARVVGIDRGTEFIEAARKRAPDIDFRNQTWDTLPEGPFDVVLLLSALHYAKDQKELLDRIYDVLAPDGLFILETGVSASTLSRWEQARRPGGPVWYASVSFLKNRLLDKYAVRNMGESVSQRGDPFKRYVFHCRRFKPIVLLVTGKAKVGKTTLISEFQKHVVTTFSADKFIKDIAKNQGDVTSELYRLIQENFQVRKIHHLTQKLIEHDLHTAFVKELVRSLPSGERMIVLEGYTLSQPEIKPVLVRLLEKKGFVVWNAERSMG